MSEVKNLKKFKKKDSPRKKDDKSYSGRQNPKEGGRKAVEKTSWFTKEPSPEDLDKPKTWNGKNGRQMRRRISRPQTKPM